MKDKLYIDGIDAFTRFGVFVHDTGYTGLVSYPSLKKVETASWPEKDGIAVDLDEPFLDKKEFQILFGCVDNFHIANFIALLSDGAYHTFNFVEIGLTSKLRMITQPSKLSLIKIEKFALQFADDFPIDHPDNTYSYLSPVGYPGLWQRGHEIDGVDLSNYGMLVLNGSHDEILKMPAVKINQLAMNDTMSGAIYDGEQVFFQEKDVTLKLLARAASFADFWRNYNALLYDLIRKGTRTFYYETTSEEYPCYYKGAKVTRFTFRQGQWVWCEFSLTLVFTSFRIRENDVLLASEDGELIITEDGEFYIDLG